MPVTNVLPSLLAFVFGAAIGSFLNVIVLRTKKRQQYWTGRSRCPRCRRPLRWFDEIPVVSYILLRGRCRGCRKPISAQYLIVEILTGLAVMFVWRAFGLSWAFLPALVAVGSMILLGLYDARWSLLPDQFSFLLVAAGLAVALMSRQPPIDILFGGAAGAGFFGLQYVASNRRWVGSGDILLGLGLGLLLGWRWLALAIFLAYFFGAIVAAVLILRRRLQLTSSMAFGPYLLASGFVAWLWGSRIIDWYFNHALFR